MTHTFDLGETSLSTSDLTLEITLHTSIEVHFNDLWSAEDVGRLEEAVLSGNVWLKQGPELRLYIYIEPTQNLIHSLSIVTSNVADITCTFKLWHDLGLAVYLESCESNTQGDGIQILLGVRRIPVRFALVKRSRIPTWLRNPQEAHPPPSIPVASVSTINVFMGINTYDELYTLTSPVRIPNCPSWNESCASTTTPVIDGDGKPNILDDLYQIQDGENSQPGTYINDDFTFSANYTHDHISQEFSPLFRNGLKEIIAGPSQQVDSYRTGPEPKPTQSLSRMVPTLFSPGYREAMDQRAQLIPSIAKSITSLLKTTRNPILRGQASNLQNLHSQPKAAQNLHPPPDTDIVNLRDTIKTSLWRIAQKQLYDPQAALKLHSSPSIPDPSFTSNLISEDSLLETSEEDIFGGYYPREDAMSDSYIGTDVDAAEKEEEEEEEDSCSLLSFAKESIVSPSTSTSAQQEIVSFGLCPDQESLLCSLLDHAPRGDELSLSDRAEHELHDSISIPWLLEEVDCMDDEFEYMLCD